jgi:hypothetical protein
MSQAKRMMEEQEQKLKNQLEGYRKKLNMENSYEMDCPYCCEALSKDDVKKEQCIHCGHDLMWNVED